MSNLFKVVGLAFCGLAIIYSPLQAAENNATSTSTAPDRWDWHFVQMSEDLPAPYGDTTLQVGFSKDGQRMNSMHIRFGEQTIKIPARALKGLDDIRADSIRLVAEPGEEVGFDVKYWLNIVFDFGREHQHKAQIVLLNGIPYFRLLELQITDKYTLHNSMALSEKDPALNDTLW